MGYKFYRNLDRFNIASQTVSKCYYIVQMILPMSTLKSCLITSPMLSPYCDFQDITLLSHLAFNTCHSHYLECPSHLLICEDTPWLLSRSSLLPCPSIYPLHTYYSTYLFIFCIHVYRSVILKVRNCVLLNFVCLRFHTKCLP